MEGTEERVRDRGGDDCKVGEIKGKQEGVKERGKEGRRERQ